MKMNTLGHGDILGGLSNGSQQHERDSRTSSKVLKKSTEARISEMITLNGSCPYTRKNKDEKVHTHPNVNPKRTNYPLRAQDKNRGQH